jgi:hypothetical protein
MAKAAADRRMRRFEEVGWKGDAGAPPATHSGGRRLGRCHRRGIAAGGGAPMRCQGWLLDVGWRCARLSGSHIRIKLQYFPHIAT